LDVEAWCFSPVAAEMLCSNRLSLLHLRAHALAC